ncbi:MAG TPA: SRPBCC family protein [Caulobacteraceae bacterium]|jgi:uncharacterized protein YndB with AHSA1/START domain|nr:SRPBCC family protein [Caulobacteraceae bacterium]
MTAPMKSQYIYVTYIKTTPEKLWAALTSTGPRDYWFGMTCVSDFTKGSPWQLKFEDGRVADTGEILEAIPNQRLVIKWRNEFKPDLKAEGWTQCTMELEQADGAVKLTVIHGADVEHAKVIEAVAGGWPKVLSNLKSLLETGSIAVQRAPEAAAANAG